MKIFCLTFGCAKNHVDSECLTGALISAGHTMAADIEHAECAILNTCGFILPAVKENIDAILELEELKAKGRLKIIGVVGCLYNRYKKELSDGFPTVDFWCESEDWQGVLAALGNRGDNVRRRSLIPGMAAFSRYLKISEGCDNKCAYCAIPAIRGSLHSLPMGVVVKEAEQLVCEGARELCVIGQDLTVYGTDFDGKSHLIELLDALESSLPHDVWLRLLYLHPSRIDARLLERVANGRQVLKYLDIPIQHADNEILASMNRAIAPDAMRNIFETARSIDPDFALRTTCMVGFPGETEEHFDHLLDFIREVRFDRMGAFTFFAEEGTQAAAFGKQVDEKVKEKRLARLMYLQEEISLERQEKFVGRTLKVLVENVNGDYAECRSFREAPEVDGIIEVQLQERKINAGNFINVKITEAFPHDMNGEIV